jgi:hypothetical protein
MPSIRRFVSIVLAAVALGALVGCANDVKKRTDGYIRPASSASVKFYVPATLPLSIRSSSPINELDRVLAREQTRSMLRLIETELNSRFAAAVSQGGIKSGDDLVIAVDVESLEYRFGPGGVFNVRAVYKNPPAGSAVWSFELTPGVFPSPQQAASEISSRIMREIQSTSMIGPPVKK